MLLVGKHPAAAVAMAVGRGCRRVLEPMLSIVLLYFSLLL